MAKLLKSELELNMQGFICKAVWTKGDTSDDVELHVADAQGNFKNDDDEICFIETPKGRLSFNRPELRAFIEAQRIILARYED